MTTWLKFDEGTLTLTGKANELNSIYLRVYGSDGYQDTSIFTDFQIDVRDFTGIEVIPLKVDT